MRRKVLALRGPILHRPGWRTFAGISALTFVAADDTVGQTPGSCDPEPRMPPAGYRFNVIPRAERYPPGRPVVGPPGIPGGFGGLYWGHQVLRDPSHEHGRPVVWLLDTTQRVAALAVHVRLSPPVVTLPARPANRERRFRPPE